MGFLRRQNGQNGGTNPVSSGMRRFFFVNSHNVKKRNYPYSWAGPPNSEVMDMRPFVMYTPCATSSRGKTGDIITFTQFEEGYLLSETRNDTESGDESDDDSLATKT